MCKTKWIIFDNKGNIVERKTLEHKDGRLYIELEPFEKELKKKGLYAHRAESIEQNHLKGKTFIEKLKCLGWKFNKNSVII